MNKTADAPAVARTSSSDTSKKRASGTVRRMSSQERRRQILETAAEYFSRHGVNAQTRGLADACGISQRLLYRYFPTKEALLEEVYRTAIAGPFKAVWFSELAARDMNFEKRLTRFYRDYLDTVFTKRWLRLFMYASLAEVDMAPSYISSMILHLLEIIVEEASCELGIDVPTDKEVQHEIGWTLHGALSHYAIRRHLYGFAQHVSEDAVIAIHVAQFLGGLAAAVDASRRVSP